MSVYLTCVDINESRPAWWKAQRNIEVLHAMVGKSVPDSTGRVLWRVDRHSGRHGDLLFILSDVVPDVTGIIEQFGWPRKQYGDQVRTSCLDGFYASIRDGDVFRFRITVNPMRSDGDGRRYPLIGRSAYDWLVGKFLGNGFEVLRMDQLSEENLPVIKNGRTAVKLKSTAYSGVVRVCDADKARHALVNGLGRSKAYGVGLMTLKP